MSSDSATALATQQSIKAYVDAQADNQAIDVFSLASNILSLSLEDDGEATKTVDLSAYLDDTTLSQEQVEDFAGGLIANGTGTHLSLIHI